MVLGGRCQASHRFPPSINREFHPISLCAICLYGMRVYLRAIIHDSIVAEVPIDRANEFATQLLATMTTPIPQLGGLSIQGRVQDWPFRLQR